MAALSPPAAGLNTPPPTVRKPRPSFSGFHGGVITGRIAKASSGSSQSKKQLATIGSPSRAGRHDHQSQRQQSAANPFTRALTPVSNSADPIDDDEALDDGMLLDDSNVEGLDVQKDPYSEDELSHEVVDEGEVSYGIGLGAHSSFVRRQLFDRGSTVLVKQAAGVGDTKDDDSSTQGEPGDFAQVPVDGEPETQEDEFRFPVSTDTSSILPDNPELQHLKGWHVEGEGDYEEAVEDILTYSKWVGDEKLLHRLLTFRGMHPLLPNTWEYDFLDLPLYSRLYASPEDEAEALLINTGHQRAFRCSRAFRTLFALQTRVHCLRACGRNREIGPIVAKEIKRFVRTIFDDAGVLDYRFKSNVAVKRLTSSAERAKASITSRVNQFFYRWGRNFRAYYIRHPKIEQPPRLLYGFMVIQHWVILLVMDSGNEGNQPRVFAEFDMSRGTQWLNSTLNIAIPVFLARERLRRMIPDLERVPKPALVDEDL